MYYKGQYEPADEYECDAASANEQKFMLEEAKKIDRGYNKIWKLLPHGYGRLKRTKIEFYTSSEIGNRIRDAETGSYFSDRVGSENEDLYFKVGLATGQCKSANGSSTLFFTSPYRYMAHMHCDLPDKLIQQWEEKREDRVRRNEIGIKRHKASTIIVR